jgi:hypothetical protein
MELEGACESRACVCGVSPARMLSTEARSGVGVSLDIIAYEWG